MDNQIQIKDILVKDTQIPETVRATAHASQITLETIARHFPNGLIAVINNDFTIEYVEGEELDKLDLRNEIVSGMHIDDISAFSETQKSRLKKDVRKTLDGVHNTFETEFRNNTYTVNTTPLHIVGNGMKALLVYYNISQRKKYETKIWKALQKEQELNELKSSFITMASHEFRTPLSAILSSVNLIQKLDSPEYREKREKYFKIIKANVHNLVVILDDYLSFEKLNDKKEALKKKWIYPDLFITALIEQIRPSKKPGQTIRLIKDKTDRKVFTDPILLEHILVNLISNAIKYSPENSVITITVGIINDSFYYMIEDLGIGIPLAEQKNLFNKFFRAQNASYVQGTGLGLHIAKQYSELLGGTIGFKSEVNKGTKFTVQIPTNQYLSTHEKNIVN